MPHSLAVTTRCQACSLPFASHRIARDAVWVGGEGKPVLVRDGGPKRRCQHPHLDASLALSRDHCLQITVLGQAKCLDDGYTGSKDLRFAGRVAVVQGDSRRDGIGRKNPMVWSLQCLRRSRVTCHGRLTCRPPTTSNVSFLSPQSINLIRNSTDFCITAPDCAQPPLGLVGTVFLGMSKSDERWSWLLKASSALVSSVRFCHWDINSILNGKA
ncbi:hypothetical protein QBC34DRAFT_223161 [Podospora aff. communis PSN243]|uniref:FHA domain-containing protein n=1 Tax=Podospora aff. communis PSN243 TaxID=3040156 RepID=A0AAV9G6B1_9PEZI|nr:hypothetical protein QBC34DRAFT_223161 [Podospora aff. communis PSN243]